MRRSVAWSGALLVGAVAWVASPELRWPARLFCAILLGPAPLLFMMQANIAATLPVPLPRVRVYVGSIIALWLLALISLAVGIASGFSAADMGIVAVPLGSYLLWTVFGLLASAVVVVAFKAAGAVEAEIMQEITPVTRAEKQVFVLLAISAGICEELTFRGFLMPALGIATKSVAAGVALSSLAFGVMHAHQRASGALRAAMLGALLAIPVVMTGSVYAAMSAHALVDIIGGLWLSRWLFRSG